MNGALLTIADSKQYGFSPSAASRLSRAAPCFLAEGGALKGILVPKGPVAEQLAATNVWKTQRSKLCQDIGRYLGPHFSAMLAATSLISSPARESGIIPKSGLLWTDLKEVLDSLPHQTRLDPQSPTPPARNDTLLVTANLSVYPKSRMTTLYLYQLLSAIRSGTLFQEYGLVRMLIWARPEDIRSTILPMTVQARGRSAVEAELACEWINEVAGLDSQDPVFQSAIYRSKRSGGPRDRAIELQSAYQTLQRLLSQGRTIPRGRDTKLIKEAKAMIKDQLDELEDAFDAGEFEKGSTEHKRLKRLQYRRNNDTKQAGSYVDLLQEHAELAQLHASGATSAEELQERERLWNDKVDALNPHSLSTFRLIRDNLHLFQQDPPAMLWDRRTLEPLAPQAMSPLLRGPGEGSKVFDLLVKVMLRNSTVPVTERLDDVWPDAAAGVLPGCAGLHDPARGGTFGQGRHAELCARALNAGQWVEMVEAWMKWPFRPRWERLERQHSEVEVEDDGSGTADGEFLL
ncbi:unnamed protein product [Parascedosporium putredinis]|uniref:Uncharacterized protein n=1 Tax=Parascedosporium putredinis TaxID=1442378 RepID=A0A9P1H588_9PEZI|nr:unnamed protein product [Parascedosporium putredinis]CAI7996293.1 unnamed protein product [Parascedosporium putredinis]